MGEPAKCTGDLGAVDRTVVLAFQLVGAVPQIVNWEQVLNSKELKDAVEATLKEHAENYVKTNPTTFSEADGKKLLNELGQKSLKAAGQNVAEQIKKSPEYKRLEKSAEKVADALKCSRAGVWFDKNKTILYIIAAGVGVGGAAALYVARTGDEVADVATFLAGKQLFKGKIIGDIELTVGLPKFKPSTREITIDLEAAKKWDQVQANFKVTAQAVDSDVKLAGSSEFVFPGRRYTLNLDGIYDPRSAQLAPVQIGVAVKVQQDSYKLSVVARAQIDGPRVTGVTTGVGVEFKSPVKGMGPLRLDAGNTMNGNGLLQPLITFSGRF
jgi:hypothetical protein